MEASVVEAKVIAGEKSPCCERDESVFGQDSDIVMAHARGQDVIGRSLHG